MHTHSLLDKVQVIFSVLKHSLSICNGHAVSFPDNNSSATPCILRPLYTLIRKLILSPTIKPARPITPQRETWKHAHWMWHHRRLHDESCSHTRRHHHVHHPSAHSHTRHHTGHHTGHHSIHHVHAPFWIVCRKIAVGIEPRGGSASDAEASKYRHRHAGEWECGIVVLDPVCLKEAYVREEPSWLRKHL